MENILELSQFNCLECNNKLQHRNPNKMEYEGYQFLVCNHCFIAISIEDSENTKEDIRQILDDQFSTIPDSIVSFEGYNESPFLDTPELTAYDMSEEEFKVYDYPVLIKYNSYPFLFDIKEGLVRFTTETDDECLMCEEEITSIINKNTGVAIPYRTPTSFQEDVIFMNTWCQNCIEEADDEITSILYDKASEKLVSKTI